jgi:hypothetical protein
MTGVIVFAALTALFFVGFGVWLWFKGAEWIQKHPEYKTWQNENTVRPTAMVMFGLGIVFPAFIYITQSDQILKCLYEDNRNCDAEGKIEDTFQVEHPNVQHGLSVYPDTKSTCKITVEILDPLQKMVMTKPLEFHDQKGPGITFTPDQAGAYHLKLTGSKGVGAIHVYIRDPKKTDGHRMPGY